MVRNTTELRSKSPRGIDLKNIGDTLIENLRVGKVDVTGLSPESWPEDGSWMALVRVKDLMALHMVEGKWCAWMAGDIDPEDARSLNAVEDDRLPYEPGWSAKDPWTVQQHLQRIRNLMEIEVLPPISLEFQMEGHFDFGDGHHRLLAAYLRGDTLIAAEVSGFQDVLLSYCTWKVGA